MTEELKTINGIDPVQLLTFVERIERLEEQRKALQNDIKEVFDEAKAANFDVKALKEILKIRKNDEDDQAQLDFIVCEYKTALGMR